MYRRHSRGRNANQPVAPSGQTDNCVIPTSLPQDIRTIRKLILSGDTQLLWRCFVPILHPMSKPASTVPMDKLTQWIGNQSITMGTAGSPDTDEFTFTTEHTTETLVNPYTGYVGPENCFTA